MNATAFLEEKGVKFTRMTHPVAFTSQEVAAEVHVPGRMMVKTVVVKADNQFYLAVLPAIYSVDFARLKALLGANEVTLATEADMGRLFPDVEVGAEPPFGKPYGLKTVVDEHLAESDKIIFQAGDHASAIQIGYEDYVNVADAITGRFGMHI